MELAQDWKKIKDNFKRYGTSSLHYSMATIKPDGSPWVTPIGSLMLNKDCTATYFEIFTKAMPINLDTDQRVVVMGVNSGRWFWLKSIFLGRFRHPPAIRLIGKAGKRRRATDIEKERFAKLVKSVRFTAGYKKMWRRMEFVRDITFEDVVSVNIGGMYRDP